MPVQSIVKISELGGAKRLDAEYYRPVYIRERKILRSLPRVKLGDIAFITDGQHGYHKLDPSSAIKHITAKCVVDNLIDVDDADRLSMETHLKNKRAACEEGDVILTTAGTIGNSGVVTPEVLPANMDQDVARIHILDKEKLSLWYLSVFLNSTYGRLQSTLETTGQVQGHLALEKVRKLEVPLLLSRDQEAIERLAVTAYREHQKSKSLYLQAEQIVLQEIGWAKLVLSQPKWWTAPLSRGREIHRLDAEHFQPKYDKLISHLKKTGRAKQIRDLLAEPIQKGVTPDYDPDGPIVAVNSQHLGRYCLNIEATDRTTEDFWKANRRAQIRQNDVMIYATGAYIGRTNAYLETTRALAGVDILLVRPTDVCNPLYLAVFLNALPGLMQSKSFASGSGQAHIYPEDVSRYWVYIPSEKFQQKVADLVQQSYQARQKAKALLEEAKVKVETLVMGVSSG